MRWAFLVLGLLLAAFVVVLALPTPPAETGMHSGTEDDPDKPWTERLADRFRPAMDISDLAPGCFDREERVFRASPTCTTRAQCRDTDFRFLTLQFDGLPAQVDFRPEPSSGTQQGTCDDDRGLSPVKLKLNQEGDTATLVIPRSGGVITVTCQNVVAGCLVRVN